MNMKFKDALNTLQKAFGIKLSSEQLAVIKYDHKTPVLVNSCAGAGKTTLLMFDIFMLLLTNKAKPENILGITFSRDARKNMQVKYRNVKEQLIRDGYHDRFSNEPTFRTFHSLFYRLLRAFPEYRKAKVISSYVQCAFTLERAIKFKSPVLSESEQLRHIFQDYSKLINGDTSYNGIDINSDSIPELRKNGWLIDKSGKINPKGTGLIKEDTNTKKLFKSTANYVSVIIAYQRYKKAKHMIDFNDMKVLLIKQLGDLHKRTIIHQMMHRYNYCFLDEFQDIDNLQYKLMKMLLSKRALSNIDVIGDDDQSIYAFRGSNPKIIINYIKDNPTAKKFQLSTNYRTNAKVLNGVIPLISDNKYRIDKSLQSANHRQGGLYMIVNTVKPHQNGKKKQVSINPLEHKPKSTATYQNSGKVLLSAALIKASQLKGNNPSVAILCRFNSDKMVAIDFLANHGVYVKPTKLLQKDIIYRTYYQMMTALSTDAIKPVIPCLRKLGFAKYEKHFLVGYKMLKKKYARKPQELKTLDELLNHLIKLDHAQINYLKNSGKMDFVKDQKVLMGVDNNLLQAVKTTIMNPSGETASAEADFLTSTYFNYMVSSKYIDDTTYETVKKLMLSETKKFKTIYKWFTREQMKIQKFKQLKHTGKYNHHICVMTIHQSKGLQYKYVFLYNLTARNILMNDLAIADAFAPDVTKKEFVHQMVEMPTEAIKSFDNINDDEVEYDSDNFDYFNDKKHKKHITECYYNLKNALNIEKKSISLYCKHMISDKSKWKNSINKSISQFESRVVNNSLLTNMSSDVSPVTKKLLKIIQHLANLLYVNTVQVATDIEEERRLIYVGITRAKSCTIFNRTDAPNPLLFELHLDKYNILMEKHHVLVPTFNDKKNKLNKINQKIRALKAQKKELGNK